MALSLAPFIGARIALVATSLVGDIKGEWYSESATEAMDKAVDLITWPDTLVYVYDTTNEGARVDSPHAVLSQESGWQDLMPTTAHNPCTCYYTSNNPTPGCLKPVQTERAIGGY